LKFRSLLLQRDEAVQGSARGALRPQRAHGPTGTDFAAFATSFRMAAGSTIQGACGVKAPTARSAGPDRSGASGVSRRSAMSRCGTEASFDQQRQGVAALASPVL
jgi:hypothetical protein